MSGSMHTTYNKLLGKLGRKMAGKLHSQRTNYKPLPHLDYDKLCQALQPGDILLVEGNLRISSAIKYLTQSTWSHAALFIGDALAAPDDGSERPRLIEVNMHEGCVASPLGNYKDFNLRICRAKALNDAEKATLVGFMISKLGLRYDMRNIFDLFRYFLPTPPLPAHWRRRMLAFGSGDPTRAISSSLIAQAFQTIHYPILPEISDDQTVDAAAHYEGLHIRHYSLYAPRDFDLSPYFEVIKPDIDESFDFRKLVWE